MAKREVMHPSKVSRYKVIHFAGYVYWQSEIRGKINAQYDLMIYKNHIEKPTFKIITN